MAETKTFETFEYSFRYWKEADDFILVLKICVVFVGHVEVLNFMLSKCTGVEVDARNALGFTPLMKAALQGRTKCAKLLLFAGMYATQHSKLHSHQNIIYWHKNLLNKRERKDVI